MAANKPNKLAFLSMPAPASYVAGLGRGYALLVTVLQLCADAHFQVLLVSQPAPISVPPEKVPLLRRSRVFFPTPCTYNNLIRFTEKPKHEEARSPKSIQNSFKTQTTSTDSSPERLTKQTMRRQTRFTTRWTRIWMRGGEPEGV